MALRSEKDRGGLVDTDSDSDDEGGRVGALAPPLTEQISNILNRYPEGGQILKELIQNADDAQANNVGFLIDWRDDHPCDRSDVMFDNFQEFQGPAFYAWNDAVFKKEDWHSLAKINQSSKKEEVLKVGRFGLGFQSVFHITDLPMVISRKHVAIIDPHRNCIKDKSETAPAGMKEKLSLFFEHRGHVSTFESIFGLNTKNKRFGGTIFRFPLRQAQSKSKISTKSYTPEEIQTKLFESLKEESSYILLFLRNVKSISLMQWTKGATKPHETFKVEVPDQTVNEPHKTIDALSHCEAFARQCSQGSDIDDSKVYVELNSVTVTVNRYHSTGYRSANDHHWLVLKVVGTSDDQLDQLGRDLSILPWVGLATRFPGQIALNECEVKTAEPFNDTDTLEAVFKQLKGSLDGRQLSIPWSNTEVNDTSGHAYCFLPLPESTAMPVHVHGYFAVTDNRRSIKWPAHDEQGKEAQWNKGLLCEMVAPAYALLLACRASLIHYVNTPLHLQIANTEHVTDAYSTWPLYPEVKNVQIWNELIRPTMECSSSLPLLWTSACGGKWIQFSEAFFLPGTFSSGSHDCSPVIFQLLIRVGVPIVCLPKAVCKTIEENKHLLSSLQGQEISPQLFRQVVKANPECCYSLSREEVYDALDYALSDMDASCYNDLVDVPLLPLKDKQTVIPFQRLSIKGSRKYVFLSKMKSLVNLLQGADSLIVDPDLPANATKKLCEIASAKRLQLVQVDTGTMCEELLPTSIWSWCKRKNDIGWTWTPGIYSMPAQSWLDALWKWVAKHSVNLSLLQNLPIVPLLASDSSQHQEVVLVKPVVQKGRLCRLSTSFTSREKPILTSILKKLEFFIVDEVKMNNCDKMKAHPDFKEFIPKLSLSLELIAKYLAGLSIASQVQTVQSLLDEEKNFLRKHFSAMSESSVSKYKRCLKSIPIYHAEFGTELESESPRFIAITHQHSGEAFLSPENSTLPVYPDNMLRPASSSDERSFFKLLSVKQLTLSDLCINHLIPLAMRHIEDAPNHWSVGDDLVVWILKQRFLPKSVIDTLSSCTDAIICTHGNTHKRADELIDPQDPALTKLFSVKSDGDHFPNEQYLQDRHCSQTLVKIGMRTWKKYQAKRTQMYNLLLNRMESINTLESSLQLSRGEFILVTLAEPSNNKLRKNHKHLFQCKFLRAEMCPTSYPHCLKAKWYGQTHELYSIEELCPPNADTNKLVGTSKPILSCDYFSYGGHAMSRRIFEVLPFPKVTETDILRHLTTLESVVVASKDSDSFTDTVMCVYDNLHSSSSFSKSLKLPSVWWRDAETSKFLSAKKFVLERPQSLHANLEPYYYFLLKTPLYKYASIFDVHNPLMPSDLANVIKEIAGHAKGKLTSQEIGTCIAVLNWLCEKKYKEGDMLMLTAEDSLKPAVRCVYDDRNWMKDSRSKSQIKAKSLLFVHDQIPQKVAKHFNVIPLSRKVAPSERLGISYSKAGQHEDITHRIGHIVKDYESNIDVFKELIQNADDAGATKIKFLIDWRQHPKESLISEELKEWQGPALIAYNNITFSDEDFDNICLVAGETKKKDPLKTGRFGVGFCATYHLTDLPSFISRRFFTMFDPHTFYLGDRISAQQPGMRVDLVENQNDLGLYLDQFKPYDDLFGCKIFHLEEDGYPGTLFRFPFRCPDTKTRSKICKTVYDERKISALVESLKEEGEELMLFLKHINKVSLYELKNGCSPSSCRKIFSIKRTGELDKRVKLMQECTSTAYKTCSFKLDIDVKDSTKKHSHTTWILSSAIKSCTDSKLVSNPDSIGLLPLAEIALKVDSSKEDWSCMPIQDPDTGKLFCFLPLPIKSKLPFHVNGFFSIGKERRNITATDDNSFGSLWNRSLAQGALFESFINLLVYLSDNLSDNLRDNLRNAASENDYLSIYYSLWNLKASGLIGETFVSTFKKRVPELTQPLVWSEIHGGCWLPPTEFVIFKDENLDKHEGIKQDAISLLLTHGYGLAKLPYHPYSILKSSLKNTKRLFNYQKFCEEILFPEIDSINAEIRSRHMKFLTERFGVYIGSNNWYEWAKEFLANRPCIPCEGSDALSPSCELIDPKNKIFKELFDVCEGRFPSEELQKSSYAMKGLHELGMTSYRLRISDLKNRAETVNKLDHDAAIQRSKHICAYIKQVYGSLSVGLGSEFSHGKDLYELAAIPFLPVKQKRDSVDVPWYGKSKSFASPSQVYSPIFSHLVFCQHPVVDIDIESYDVLSCLGISSRRPTLDVIISHLECLVEHTMTSKSDDTTDKYLVKSMSSVYSHLNIHYTKAKDIEQLLQVGKIIWQDGHFLRPDQVVKEWKHSCYPYLCELSSANKHYDSYMEQLGIKGKPTAAMLENLLQSIADDFALKPVDDEILPFIEYIVSKLALEVRCLHKLCRPVKLPDQNKIMRDASHLAENVGDAENTEWLTKLDIYNEFMSSGDCYFVHSSIPRDRAITLGVLSMLQAVVKEIEDDSFLKGTPFGQQEDLCDRLNGILEKYPPGVSIFQEFIQNADDAQATEIIFVLDHRTNFSDSKLVCSKHKWKALQHTPALCVFNNRKFTEADIEGITRLGRGGKKGEPDLIGKFGIGFNVAYHVTDCPSFISYAEDGSPKYLCVFDPTRSFLPLSKDDLPGKKWDFKDKSHYSGFSDQLQPYLDEDLPKLQECAPRGVQDRKHGHVVFRLPLTRLSPTSSTGTSNKLHSGTSYSPSDLSKLFDKFSDLSQDMLLFLNHLRHISVFEILRDGRYVHRFTTTGSVPQSYHSNFQQYAGALKQSIQAIKSGSAMKRISLPHQMSITYIVTNQEEQYSSRQRYEWLVQRAVGGRELNIALLKAGLRHGLRPVGGVATLLQPMSSYEYHLFCFLPLPIQSNLPVHINGHFSVDDSRKHLETRKDLDDWNPSIARSVIVPAYIDLITTAKQLMFNTDMFDKHKVQRFYSLFPRPNSFEANTKEKTNVGELENLKIAWNFYEKLLKQNPSIIVHKAATPNSTFIWMSLKDCLFFVQIVCGKQNLILAADSHVRTVLVSLGMPIADAPRFIYDGCLMVDHTFSARVEPKKIIQYLRSISCTDEQKEVIKENIQPFLKYCITGYNPNDVEHLFHNALYLLACDGTLRRGTLFQSAFSDLLPHHAHKFIDPVLEKSEVGKKLCSDDYQVICPLTLEFVSDHVGLPRTRSCCDLDADNSSVVKRLWECIAEQCVTVTTVELLKTYFSSIAIIPASDNKLYPVCMSMTLVRDSLGNCNLCSVMKKIGYPQIDFEKIGFVDSSSKVHRNIVDVLTSCFQNGGDIINCFQLDEPKNLDVQLSDIEVQAFITSVGQLKRKHLRRATKYLLQMPLFLTIDGSWISLSRVSKVFILSSTDLPLQGIPATYNGQVVLNATASTVSANFYRNVIPEYMSAQVNPQELYIQLILPNIQTMSENDIIRHVKYISIHRDDDMKQAFDELKEVAFIKHNKQFHKVSKLCDPTVKYYTVFHKDSVLPAAWYSDQMISILKSLGLRTNVTTAEWLDSAKDLAKRFSTDSISDIELKSQLLLDILIKIIKDQSYNHGTFLEEVADITFIYSPQKWLLFEILSHLSPNQQNYTSIHMYMVKLRGSVSVKQADLACLCTSVLPESCQELISNQSIKNALHVEAPASPNIVAENLKRLCSHLNVTCVRSLDMKPEHRKELVHIFEKHYECLGTRKPHWSILNDFKDMMCVLLPSNPVYLQLVKPTQLVEELLSGCSLEPYCYRVTSSLHKCMKFLTAIGVRQKLNAQDYIDILRNIHDVLGDDGNAESSRDMEVIKCAYFEIVRCLRQGDNVTGDSNSIWLPDQAVKLVGIQNLFFNDAPSYVDRLPQDCRLKMILPPPSDRNGICSLPKSLGVKPLSEIITEELLESCRSPDVVCNDEELYAQGKRSEDRRCIFVKKILETLKCEELCHGLCRIYYTEHQVSPSESFILSVRKLRRVQVRCIDKIKTVLCVNGVLSPSTEDSNKFCYLCKEGNSFVLYIAPHNDAPEEDVLLDLAFCIRKLLNNEIRDLAPITAAFNCEPSHISKALNRHNISEYTVDDDKNARAVMVGTPISWGDFDHQDSLIVLNFDPEDPVRYMCEDGSLIHAEVVKCKPIDHKSIHQLDLLEPTLTIKVQEDDVGSKHSSDSSSTADDDDDNVLEDATASESTINVSPIQVFKLLSIPQKKSLWGKGTSQFACPLVLASVPFNDFSSLEQWLHKIFDSPLFSKCSPLTLKVLTLRLLRHIHYLFVIQKKSPLLFNKAALKVHEIEVQIESAHDQDTGQSEDDQMQDLITKMMECLTLEDTSSISDIVITIDEEDGGDDGSETAAMRTNSSIFPSSSLINILDGGSSDGSIRTRAISQIGSGRSMTLATTKAATTAPSLSATSGSPVASASIAPPTASQIPPATQSMMIQPSVNVLSRFTATTRSQRRSRKPQASRFQPIIFPAHGPVPVAKPYVPPPPKISMQNATAWLEQAKADFKAAGRLLQMLVTESPSCSEAASNSVCAAEVEFPALVCFLCHETVEKCMKGVLYAYCGLSPTLVDNGNLVTLHDSLESSPHCPHPLFATIKDCAMSVSTHENKSRYPNYQNPPCAPASIYTTEDASEAFMAAKMLIERLSSEEKFNQVLGDLDQMPARKFVSTLRSVRGDEEYPSDWDAMDEKDEVELFLLDPEAESDEYDRVTTEFTQTLPNAKIVKVHRMQNKTVWAKYLHCSQMMGKIDPPILGEKLLFHGTKQNDPKDIYKGTEGFDMRFSRNGMWGRGNYFAVNASYSDNYAFHAGDGIRKMFAAWVLTGRSYHSKPKYDLTKPPYLNEPADNSSTAVRRRYDSVCGITDGTVGPRIYITYDNVHAYPAYLITYKK